LSIVIASLGAERSNSPRGRAIPPFHFTRSGNGSRKKATLIHNISVQDESAMDWNSAWGFTRDKYIKREENLIRYEEERRHVLAGGESKRLRWSGGAWDDWRKEMWLIFVHTATVNHKKDTSQVKEDMAIARSVEMGPMQ